ncbi:hypothetical protein LINPERPRIM_LOCUS31855 [Linum perenne]
MGSEGPKAVVIHVTGFKKFQGVSQNPTETIVNKLKDYVEKRGLPAGVTLGSCTILETAGDGARKMLYQTLESSTATNGDKNEQVVWVCNQFVVDNSFTCSYHGKYLTVFVMFLQVHMGVNSGAVKFAIERQAVNEATFRCPDELGWQPNVSLFFFFPTVFCVVYRYDNADA